ncbi:oxidoreductase [Wenyingzhuangia fucanilytica]|uniref:Oxidoreductase n=1 Tax=Wenyingzhuangia fucanilytica TaxID=1790137 RepID=A0A1B1Y5I2_9FLAO|nr:Gfo/Idh/MocA family oxidoreductase [Wenyingzhuangia fucanilytica]ANW96041.1 oxidoreductase [Wenyingzhuangia fucanilytica]
MKQVNWGIIGVGSVCEVKSAPAMYKTPNSTVISVMRRDAEKAKDYAHRHHIPEWTTNADEIINHPDINAVYIATPPKYHKAYALKVAEAGKACYIEKPMAITHQECVEIEKAFKEKNLPLFIAYYRTCLPNFLKAKELIDNGTIGTLLNVQINLTKPLDVVDENYVKNNWRVNPKMAGDGYFYDLGSHQINILEFLIGSIDHVQGLAINQSKIHKSNDVVAANILFKNNVIGSCFWAFNNSISTRRDELIINGTKGNIKLACFNDNPVLLTMADGSQQVFEINYPEHVQQPLITSIVNDLINNTNHTYSTGKIGAKTNYWIEQISGLLSS